MGNKNRGSGTHGHGSSKKNRGAGNRGGRGKAGLGKKAKHKKSSIKGDDHLGEKGFKRDADDEDGINLRDIDQRIDAFVADGVAEEDGDSYVFNARDAGYDKVLGAGRLTKDIDVKADAFSDTATRKIEEHGNEAIVLEASDEA